MGMEDTLQPRNFLEGKRFWGEMEFESRDTFTHSLTTELCDM